MQNLKLLKNKFFAPKGLKLKLIDLEEKKEKTERKSLDLCHGYPEKEALFAEIKSLLKSF